MFLKKNNFNKLLHGLFLPAMLVGALFVPDVAFADWKIIDKLNLAPFIPRVLDAFMLVARGTYEYFVGNGDGIIYLLVWTFLVISVFMYVFTMFFPKRWTDFIGFSNGGAMWEGKVSGFGTAETVLKNCLRAVIAATFLLQVKPVYITEWLINPFLEFGAIYTESITNMIYEQNMVPDASNASTTKITCPQSVLDGGWLSKDSCDFLIQPVSTISKANNVIVKRGIELVVRGLVGLTAPVPQFASGSLLNIITGVILAITFIGCNFFMALLIIQGIFNFGMSLILYPFNVLAWVAKKNDKWFDIWPPFSGIIKALQDLVITMIACSFVLIINIAIVRALFGMDKTGGNILNQIFENTASFGGHSLLWLSSILTFFLMRAIFDLTREQLNKYSPGMNGLYDQTKGDTKATFKWAKNAFESIKKIRKMTK